MKLLNADNPILLFALLMASLLGLQACGDNSTGVQPPPDFSTVPAAYDTSEAVSKVTQDNGLIIYTISESDSPLAGVVARDAVRIYYTGRKTDGEIFASSYANGNTSPAQFSNLFPQSSSLIEGFREGLMGMREGEKRTIVIPPSLGYGESRPGTNGFDLRNDTLVYDVLLDEILN